MKHITPSELKSIAKIFSAELTITAMMAQLDFGQYGFVSTQVDSKGNFYKFKYYGLEKKRVLLEDVWFELMNARVSKIPLTYRSVRRLIGKTIKVGYYDMEETYEIIIEGIRCLNKETGRQLLFRIPGSTEIHDYFFERHGAFSGGGAEPIFIDEIL